MKKTLIIVLCAVVLFAAAYFGYDYLSKSYIPENGGISQDSSESESSKSEEEGTPAEESSSDVTEEVFYAPDFTVYDKEGNPVSLSDFEGKPVIINFWATWCGYCVGGMPNYQKLFEKYGDDVVLMMINVTDGQSETKEDAMAFIEEKGYTFTVYYDTDLSATHTYGAYSLPATGFVTKSGVYAGGQIGSMPEETLYYYVDTLLTLE